MNQIYFTADLHFGHANILKHSPRRPFADVVDIKAHDEWLLEKLPGQKFLNAQSMDLRFDVGIDGTLANLEFLRRAQHQLFSDHRIMHNPRLLTGDFYFTKLLTLPSCHRSDLEK